jgi:hypothetical protein
LFRLCTFFTTGGARKMSKPLRRSGFVRHAAWWLESD